MLITPNRADFVSEFFFEPLLQEAMLIPYVTNECLKLSDRHTANVSLICMEDLDSIVFRVHVENMP